MCTSLYCENLENAVSWQSSITSVSYNLSALFHAISEPSKEMFNAYIVFKMGAPEDTSLHSDQWISVLFVI